MEAESIFRKAWSLDKWLTGDDLIFTLQPVLRIEGKIVQSTGGILEYVEKLLELRNDPTMARGPGSFWKAIAEFLDYLENTPPTPEREALLRAVWDKIITAVLVLPDPFATALQEALHEARHD